MLNEIDRGIRTTLSIGPKDTRGKNPNFTNILENAKISDNLINDRNNDQIKFSNRKDLNRSYGTN